jgi:hypothetical protein
MPRTRAPTPRTPTRPCSPIGCASVRSPSGCCSTGS